MTRIGFSNMSNELSITVAFRESIEQAVSEADNMELILRTNDMDGDKVMQHAHEFTDMGVDIAVIINTVERMNVQLGLHFKLHKTPLIAIEIPIPMGIYLGIDNVQAGKLASKILVDWVNANWNGTIDKLIVVTDHRHITNVQDRLKLAASETLVALDLAEDDLLFMDGLSSRVTIAQRSEDLFANWNDGNIGVICDNDDTALGILDTAHKYHRESNVAVVGQNATLAFAEFDENPDTRLIGTIDFKPYEYGGHLVRLINQIRNGEPYDVVNNLQPYAVTKDAYLKHMR